MATNDLFDQLRSVLRIGTSRLKVEALHVLLNFVSSATNDLIEEALGLHLKVNWLNKILEDILSTLEERTDYELNKTALKTLEAFLKAGDLMASRNNG